MVSATPLFVVNKLGMKFSTSRNTTVLGLIFMDGRATIEKICYAVNSLSVPSATFIIIVACTIILSMGLKRATEWRKKSTQSQGDRTGNRNQKVGRMVVTISTLFIICFIPINISMLAMAFDPELSFSGKHFNIVVVLSGLSLLLESINSSMNVFIYYKMSTKYRETLDDIFCRKKHKF